MTNCKHGQPACDACNNKWWFDQGKEIGAHNALGEPMFWVRLCGDGLYEGPYHHKSAEGKLLRDEKPSEWHPLYLAYRVNAR